MPMESENRCALRVLREGKLMDLHATVSGQPEDTVPPRCWRVTDARRHGGDGLGSARGSFVSRSGLPHLREFTKRRAWHAADAQDFYFCGRI